ncbi:Hypothetical predicted protein, partial [Paramuricea clavata]
MSGPTLDALIRVESILRWRKEECHNFTVSSEIMLKFNMATIYLIKKEDDFLPDNAVKARKTKAMVGINQETDIGDIQDFPEDITEEDLENIGEESNKDFNRNVLLVILDTETDELDDEFRKAVTEIEGKKSFPCSYCTK